MYNEVREPGGPADDVRHNRVSQRGVEHPPAHRAQCHKPISQGFTAGSHPRRR